MPIGKLISILTATSRCSAALAILSLFACTKEEPVAENGVTSTKIALNSSPQISDFVVFAQNSITFNDRVQVSEGDVGVSDLAAGATLTSGYELSVGYETQIDISRSIIANRVNLRTRARVGDVQANKLSLGFAYYSRLLPLPAMPSLPNLEPTTPGNDTVSVGVSAIQEISEGKYGRLAIKERGILRLSGGTYHIASVDIADDARIEALAKVRILVLNRFSSLSRVRIEGASGVALSAADIRIEVSGPNGGTGLLRSLPMAASFGNDNTVRAVVLAPNGTLHVGQRSRLWGAIAARDVYMDIDARVTFQSGLGPATCTPVDCDDRNPCTIDTCRDGTCGHIPVAIGTSCSDGNVCNGTELCNSQGSCSIGESIICQASDQCHDTGTCNPATGICSNPSKIDGTECNDGNACTKDDSCIGGICQVGAQVTLDDQNPCTIDSCDPIAGATHIPVGVGTSCSNGNACDGEEVCDGSGVCMNGLPPIIDDSNPCTIDSCDAILGVSHANVAQDASCADSDHCNGEEVCSAAGECTPGLPVYVDDQNPCTIDDCDPELGITHALAPECVSLPPDPVALASPVPPDVATTVFESTRFLYEDGNPIQRGVAPGTIDARRAAVVRGNVQTRLGNALAGVVVQILNHPEYGFTLSRADGGYDLAVNGGEELILDFQRSDYLPAQRRAKPPWQGYDTIEALSLVEIDEKSTMVHLDAVDEIQVARGSLVQDEWGQRQTTMLFVPGTEASFLRDDGAVIPATDLTVRATEYTVGQGGPAAMPGALPPNSAYTHAFDLSVDEARAQNARSVVFSQPVITYVENFLEFPTGIAVPLGAYDRQRGTWIASDNGIVIKILDVAGGRAELSLTQDEAPASSTALAAVGITQQELGTLASLYAPGQSLWRMPIPHFSAWDANWGWGPPSGAMPPDSEDPAPEGNCSPPQGDLPGVGPGGGGSTNSERQGSLDCVTQTNRQHIAIAGTSESLSYSSDRVAGFAAANSVDVRVNSATMPTIVKQVIVEVEIAGRTYSQTSNPGGSPVHRITWDRKDAYGRTVYGQHPAVVRVGYSYESSYSIAPRFGYNGNGATITAGRGGGAGISRLPPIVLWKTHYLTTSGVDRFDSRDELTQGLGGWSLKSHHRYDPVGRTLYLGSGARVDTATVPAGTRINVNAIPTFQGASLADGANIKSVTLNGGTDILSLTDGSLYFTESSGARIWHIRRDGTLRRLAGGGSLSPGDGQAARQAMIGRAIGLSLRNDGMVVFADGNWIKGVDRNGILHVLAGTGVAGYSGDGGPATEAMVNSPQDLGVGPDQSIYVADNANNRVRRITPEGRIETYAGTGAQSESGNGGSALLASINRPSHLAVGSDGTIYVASTTGTNGNANRVRRITPTGTIVSFAGGCDDWRCTTGPGRVANGTIIDGFSGMALGPDGKLYYSQSGYYTGSNHPGHHVWRVNAQGILELVVGGDVQGRFCADKIPAIPSCFGNIGRLDVGVDGTVYVLNNTYWDGQTQFDGTGIVSAKPQLPGFSNDATVLPSSDGTELYEFDRLGHHFRTRSALTGTIRQQFLYGTSGLLTGIVDGDGRTTTIERDSTSRLTAIIGPDGQRSSITLDGRGYLSATVDPSGRTTTLQHDAGGLLASIADGRGGTYTFSYDDLGHVIESNDAGNAFNSLERSSVTTSSGQIIGHQVIRTGPEGRAKTYKFAQQPSGIATYSDSDASGSVNRSDVDLGGGVTTYFADGSTTSMTRGWEGISDSSSVPQSFVTRAPSGLAQSWKLSKSAVRDGTGKLTSATVNGLLNNRQYTSSFNAATMQWTRRSPAGRQIIEKIDAQERVVEVQTAGLESVRMTYDQGKLTFIRQGTGADERVTRLNYDSRGFLDAVENALNQVTTFVRDDAGRVLSQVLPDTRSVGLTYNENGDVTSVVPPGRPAHLFDYTPVNLLQSYSPPTIPDVATPSTVYGYDRERNLLNVTRPDGIAASLAYDNANRLTTMALPAGYGLLAESIALGYTPTTGQLASLQHSAGVGITYTNDGFLVTQESITGLRATPVVLTRGFDNDFRQIVERIDGANQATFLYDNDSLLTQAGIMVLTRSPQNGLLTGTTLGQVSDAWTYNGFGEPTSYAARVGTTELFRDDFTVRDKLGRIVTKIETVQGNTVTWGYSYDLAGRLTDVTRNGAFYSHYSYDSNGNRLTAETTAPTSSAVAATYDAQDRLLTHGSAVFTYTANGELRAKTENGQTTTYTYDVLGNLRIVQLPNGTRIDYLVDGRNRRVGKRVNGTLVQALVYSSQLAPAAELDGGGNIVARFVYGTKVNVPEYMVKGGVTYRIITDHLGSPRLVVDTATGTVAQRIDYDEWGVVLSDTNPGFQPFGFAGGIYDRDTGLVRFGARDYDAVTGRWTAKDPIGFRSRSRNLLAYVEGDPVNLLDHEGARSETPAERRRRQYRRPGDEYALGRDGALIEPGDKTSRFLCDRVSDMDRMSRLHDPLVGFLTSLGLPDELVNIPTMPLAYAAAIGAGGSYNSSQRDWQFDVDIVLLKW